MKIKLLLASILLSASLDAQTGGVNAFPFLDLMYNAHDASLGGDFLTGYGDDVNLGVLNPSMLNSKMHKGVSVNQSLQSGGVNYGMFSYGFGLKKPDNGTMVGYVKYVSYGKMDRTSINGISEGTFSPIEMIAGAGYGQALNPRISVGVKANIIYSQLETYSALGGSIDLAGTYKNEEKGVVVTANVKNFGYQFKSHTSGYRTALPVEFQLAGAYKLKHAPFRLTLLAHHLNDWDITYNDPNLQPTIDPLSGDSIPVPRAGIFEKVGQHLTYQLEMDFTKVVHFRLAFDYHRRKQLALATRPGAAGLSFGLGLHFSKFMLDYGFVIYSQAGFNNILTLSSNLSSWRN
jgi:hypothetical protein